MRWSVQHFVGAFCVCVCVCVCMCASVCVCVHLCVFVCVCGTYVLHNLPAVSLCVFQNDAAKVWVPCTVEHVLMYTLKPPYCATSYDMG